MKALLRVVNLLLLVISVIGICGLAIFTRQNLWTVPPSIGVAIFFVVLGSTFMAGEEDAHQSTRDIAWWSNLAIVLVMTIGSVSLVIKFGVDQRMYGALSVLPSIFNLIVLGL